MGNLLAVLGDTTREAQQVSEKQRDNLLHSSIVGTVSRVLLMLRPARAQPCAAASRVRASPPFTGTRAMSGPPQHEVVHQDIPTAKREATTPVRTHMAKGAHGKRSSLSAMDAAGDEMPAALTPRHEEVKIPVVTVVRYCELSTSLSPCRWSSNPGSPQCPQSPNEASLQKCARQVYSSTLPPRHMAGVQ